jgi:molybdate transport system substrate-binding protein
MFRRILLPLVCACALLAGAPADAAQPPNIAAASDLKFALEDIAAAFTRATGEKVALTFGSSGNLARQIRQGAPFAMLLSADELLVEALAKDGFTRGSGDLYAVGRIVYFAPTGSSLVPDADLASLKRAVSAGRIGRFAIANPEHAPYGRAAKEALQSAGIWDGIEPRLVLGENVSQAAQFATTGGADGAIFAYSLALSPAVGAKGKYVLIPESAHKPLRQRMVLLRGAGPVAERFYGFVKSDEARATLDRYGFTLPGR